ncbi:MAG: 4Fe-4S binding protein [Chloroflexi bacterium]|nr:4Fe-4S binding protein [Chloroflexota bacterium]
MIYVQVERCTGCGVCIQICPAVAIALQRGVAAIDQAECTECEVCLEACPEGAILSVSEPAEEVGLPALRPEPEVIRIQVPQLAVQPETEMAPVPWHAKVLPTVAAALVYVGRELPRIVPAVLDALERRSSERTVSEQPSNGQGVARNGRGGGQRHRRRRRGG